MAGTQCYTSKDFTSKVGTASDSPLVNSATGRYLCRSYETDAGAIFGYRDSNSTIHVRVHGPHNVPDLKPSITYDFFAGEDYPDGGSARLECYEVDYQTKHTHYATIYEKPDFQGEMLKLYSEPDEPTHMFNLKDYIESTYWLSSGTIGSLEVINGGILTLSTDFYLQGDNYEFGDGETVANISFNNYNSLAVRNTGVNYLNNPTIKTEQEKTTHLILPLDLVENQSKFNAVDNVSSDLQQTYDNANQRNVKDADLGTISTITNWLQSIFRKPQTRPKSWWSNNTGGYPKIVYSEIPITTSATGNLFNGAVLMNDGRVLFVPYEEKIIGLFNPADNSYMEVQLSYTFSSAVRHFSGAILNRDGRIFIIPNQSPEAFIYTPITGAIEKPAVPVNDTFYFSGGVLMNNGEICFSMFNEPTTKVQIVYNFTTGFRQIAITGSPKIESRGAVLMADGRVLHVIHNTSTDSVKPLIVYQPADDTFTQVDVGPNSLYNGGVLMPDGRVCLVPANGRIGLFNPADNTFTTVAVSETSFEKGALLADGRVVFSPNTGSKVGIFNPLDNSFSTLDITNSTTGAFSGALTLPDGRVILAPQKKRSIGVATTSLSLRDKEVPFHPFFNSF